jgi:RNA polymerase sigma-70 factor (ECF subfamily)
MELSNVRPVRVSPISWDRSVNHVPGPHRRPRLCVAGLCSTGSSARPVGGAPAAVLARAVSAVGVGAVPRNAVHAQGPERGSRAWHVNDRAGLRLCQAVDRARPSFDDAFRAEYPAVVRVVAPIVGSRADAEGVAQDAFVKAYTRWRSIGRYDRPGAWVRRVAIRDAVRVAERSRRAAGTRAAKSGPDDPADAVATQVDLTRLLGELPARQRACVVLHHLADWPVADVAEALGCAEATVRVHLHRARAALANALDAENKELSDGR